MTIHSVVKAHTVMTATTIPQYMRYILFYN
jgi:hypothetical protein